MGTISTSPILVTVMAQNNTFFQDQIAPSLDTVKQVLASQKGPKKPNLVPLYGQISSDLITPSAAYLKVVAHTKSPYSVLFESAASEQVGRYSFVGAGPRKILKTGEGHGESCDPIPALEKELSQFVVADVPDLRLPPLTGGAIGYIGYDCVRQVQVVEERHTCCRSMEWPFVDFSFLFQGILSPRRLGP